MYSADVRIGQTVRYDGHEFVVLDRHPENGVWWLQDAKTGQVSANPNSSDPYWRARGWYHAKSEDLTLVRDEYRPDTVAQFGPYGPTEGRRIRARAGAWVAVAGHRPNLNQIYHLPTGKSLMSLSQISGVTRTREALDELAQVTNSPFVEVLRQHQSELESVMFKYEQP